MDDLPGPGEAPEQLTPDADSRPPEGSTRPGRLARAWAAVASALTAVLESGRQWVPGALLIAISPGLFIWPLLDESHRSYIMDNQLDGASRTWGLLALFGSVAAVGLIYAVVAFRARRRSGDLPVVTALRRTSRWLAGFVVLPFLPPLLITNVETRAPYMTVILVGCAAVAAVVACYLFPWAPRRRLRPPAWFPPLVVLLGCAAYAVVVTRWAINQHHNLLTRTKDMALYDNIFWQTSQGWLLGSSIAKGGSHVSAHVDPILILLTPIYMIAPGPELLLGLQTVWLASSAFPMYLLCRERLKRSWLAALLALVVLLHPAVHGANFYEFHSLSLVAPLLIWAIYFIEIGAAKRYAVVFILILLTREDMALLSCFVGLYAVMSRKAVRLGVLSMVGAAVYFLAIKLLVMPDPTLLMAGGPESHSYAYYYTELIPHRGEGALGMLASLVTNPFYVLRHAFAAPKLFFLAKMFVPVLLLPLLAPRGKIMLVFGLAFILLASREPVFTTHFQYTSMLYPIIFALVPIALASLHEQRLVEIFGLDAQRLVRAAVLGVVVASLGMSAMFGGLVPNNAFRAGFNRLQRTVSAESRARYEWVATAAAKIPPEASVSATRELTPHVSSRRLIKEFPEGWGSDYLFLTRRRLGKQGRANLRRLKRLRAYEVVDEHEESIWLLRRNAEVELPEPRGSKGRR